MRITLNCKCGSYIEVDDCKENEGGLYLDSFTKEHRACVEPVIDLKVDDNESEYNDRKQEELEEAFRIVSPIAQKVGMTENDTRELLAYFQEMDEKRGMDMNRASHVLRDFLKKKDEKTEEVNVTLKDIPTLYIKDNIVFHIAHGSRKFRVTDTKYLRCDIVAIDRMDGEISALKINNTPNDNLSRKPFSNKYTDEDIEYLRKWKNKDYHTLQGIEDILQDFEVVYFDKKLLRISEHLKTHEIKSFSGMSKEELIKLAKELC